MDELERYQRCVERLRKAVNEPVSDSGSPSSYAELLREVQELRRNVALQTMEAKAKLALAKTIRDRLRDEIPEALSLVVPHRLGEFRNLCQGPSGPKTPIKIQTPLSGRKRLNQDAVAMARKLLDREAAGNMTPKSPRMRTPVSGKKLLQSRSLLRHTPVSALKCKRLFAIKQQFALSPTSTPEMPRFKRQTKVISERKSVTKTLIAPLIATNPPVMSQDSQAAVKDVTASKDGSATPEMPTLRLTRAGSGSEADKSAMTKPPQRTAADFTDREQSTASLPVLPKATPEMKERILFFNNPNIENIHQRYVAIQDSEEQTCLLSKRTNVKKSTTPERPVTGVRKVVAPSTPSLPLVFDPSPKKSVTPDMPAVRRTPATGVNNTAGKSGTGRKTRISRTPSPPRFTASSRDTSRAARLCLASKLDKLPSGQDERDMAARGLVPQKGPIQEQTPERPLPRRVTFKPPLPERSKTCLASISTPAMETFTNDAVTRTTQQLPSDRTRPTLTEKTPELRECLKRAQTKTPLLDAANRSNRLLFVYDAKSGSEHDTKSTNGTGREANAIQQNSTRRQVQATAKCSENKLHSKTPAKTPIKCNGSKNLFKASAKTPVNHVLSVSVRTDEKLRTIRPSKMQRQTGK